MSLGRPQAGSKWWPVRAMMVDRLIFGWIPGLDRREGYGVQAKLRSLIRRACYELYRSWVSSVRTNVLYRKQNRQSQLSLHQFIKQGFCSCFGGDTVGHPLPHFCDLRSTNVYCLWLEIFRNWQHGQQCFDQFWTSVQLRDWSLSRVILISFKCFS